MSTRKAPASSRLSGPRRPPDRNPQASGAENGGSRRRSNSQSQVSAAPSFSNHESSVFGQKGREDAKTLRVVNGNAESRPQKRHQAEFYVTLVSLNDTFVTKHIHVPYYPDTCKLGRPTGTKVKPHVTNGYFDSRVLSRNHACMYVNAKSGQLMVQDMGSSNGTFVNSEKLSGEPVAVNEGDTINLGFNIQVETNHKQISARIDKINVVSNNPGGVLQQMLPGLTKSVMSGFSEADMRHYEFIQGLCSQLAPSTQTEVSSADTDSDTDFKKQSLKAFDHGMFSDIVPPIGELFENSANFRNDDTGLHKNSGIQASPDLLTTLDYLGANLAKVKQQNATLTSLEVFFSRYVKDVDAINTEHVQKRIKKIEDEQESRYKIERENTAHTLREQEGKLSAQSRLVSSLEAEIAALRSENRTLVLANSGPVMKNIPENEDNDVLENEFKFTHSDPQPAHFSSSDDEKIAYESSREFLGKTSLTPHLHENVKIPGSIPPEFITDTASFNASSAQEQGCNGSEKSEGLASKNVGSTENTDLQPLEMFFPYAENLHRTFYKYKHHGAVVGFFVVIAGLVYQKTKSG